MISDLELTLELADAAEAISLPSFRSPASRASTVRATITSNGLLHDELLASVAPRAS